MKNTMKKVLCTALAAVSLSAFVTVPSSFNTPNSNNAVVNVIESDAAKKIYLYQGYIKKGNDYSTRSQPKDGKKYIYDNKDLGLAVLHEYFHVTVYEEKNGYARISASSEKKPRWVKASRIFHAKENEFTICAAGRHGGIEHYKWSRYYEYKNGLKLSEYVCPYCAYCWTKEI